MLDQRSLNRATLARQHLLARADMQPLDAIRWFIGLQAQEPPSPYVTLWSRISDFDPDAVSTLIWDRTVVRTAVMRNTIHLLAADDALALRPLCQPVVERQFRSTQFAKDTAALDTSAVVAAGRALLEEEPQTNAQVGARLSEGWPGIPKGSLAQVLRHELALVQVPPRGTWGASHAATSTTIEAWVGQPLRESPSIASALLRFIAAYGPASVRDLQQWCGLTRLKAVVDGMGDQLVTFSNEQGVMLYDLPDALRPSADTPAPPRFLADYDNMLISLADRSRFASSVDHKPFEIGFGLSGSLLLDGVVGGIWKVVDRVMEVRSLRSLRGEALHELRQEADAFAAFLATGYEVDGVTISRLA